MAKVKKGKDYSRLTFGESVALLHKKDPSLRDDGFYWLKDHAAEYVDELMEVTKAEQDLTKRWLLVEVLGFTKSRKVLLMLEAELEHPDPNTRSWAKHSLKELGFREARAILDYYEFTHPDSED